MEQTKTTAEQITAPERHRWITIGQSTFGGSATGEAFHLQFVAHAKHQGHPKTTCGRKIATVTASGQTVQAAGCCQRCLKIAQNASR